MHNSQQSLVTAIDETVYALLAEAGCTQPPVSAIEIADRLGVGVLVDDAQQARGRYVRLRASRPRARGAIVLRPEPRPERLQWAVAHELGEYSAWRVFQRLGSDPADAPPSFREELANRVASHLLLPTDWYLVDAERHAWELPDLKAIYCTASHELIARRMLDFSTSVVISVFDHGQLTWRRSAFGPRVPSPTAIEQDCWQQATATGERAEAHDEQCDVRCWAIHEEGWKREILRTAACNFEDDR